MSKASEEMSENASKLLELARKRFGELNEAEEELFRCFADGEIADRSDKTGENNNPDKSIDWDKNKRVMKAKCIFWLCTDGKALELATHNGIRVRGARIDGELDLSDARISFPLYFEKSAFTGEIYLRRAEIRYLCLDGTHTGRIYGDELKVEGSVYLRNDFKAVGKVDLSSATIGVNLECDGSKFINEGATAFSADGLKVGADVFLHNGFKANGEVRLVGATIGGDLNGLGSQFINKGATALNANSADIGGSVYLRDSFKADGEVNLVIATIGGSLECDGGQFINSTGCALRADSMKVKRHVFLRQGFKAEGKVSMNGATIDEYFVWKDVNSPEEITLDLRSVSVGTLLDDKNSWPGEENLFLNNFEYKEIDDEAPRDAERRIDWLRRQDGFWPQPYEQLAAVLGKGGQDEDARKVLVAKNEEKAGQKILTMSEKIWYRVFGPMIGYGYRPWRALGIGLVIVLIGWLFFWAGDEVKIMTPTKESAAVSGSTSGKINISPDYPPFCALVYSLDVFLPVVDLHQSSYWLPNANRDGKLPVREYKIPVYGKILRYYLWFEIIAGWILTSLFVVGLTGLVRT